MDESDRIRLIVAFDPIVKGGQIDFRRDLDVLVNYDVPRDFDPTILSRIARLANR